MENASVTVSYYIPQYLKDRIDKEAKLLDRSASWIVSNALAKHFEQLDKSKRAEKPDTGSSARAAGNIGA